MLNRRKLNNLKDIAIIVLLIFLGWRSCDKPSNTHTRELVDRDSVTVIEKEPVVTNTTYTSLEPTRIIENHYYHEVDTNAIVEDYMRSRYYSDSLINDTVSYWWTAKVNRNILDTFTLRTSFRPRRTIITETYEQVSPSIGVMALYVGKPYIGAFGTWQNKRWSLSGGLSPMNGGAAMIGVGLKIK